MLLLTLLGLLIVFVNGNKDAIIVGPNPCREKMAGSHPELDDPNCSNYYVCKDDKQMEARTCAGSNKYARFYDPVKKMCSAIYDCPGQMSDSQIAERCKGQGFENKADTNDKSCTAFFFCKRNHKGQLQLLRDVCPSGQRFDSRQNKCTTLYDHACPTEKKEGGETQKERISGDCINKSEGPHLNEDDPTCISYYFCNPQGKKKTLACEKQGTRQTYFDPIRHACSARYVCNKRVEYITDEYISNEYKTNFEDRYVNNQHANNRYALHHPFIPPRYHYYIGDGPIFKDGVYRDFQYYDPMENQYVKEIEFNFGL